MTINKYAAATQRGTLHHITPERPAVAAGKRPPRPLTTRQRAAAEQARADVLAHMPEMVAVIRGFVEADMIDGWRDVTVTVHNKKDRP